MNQRKIQVWFRPDQADLAALAVERAACAAIAREFCQIGDSDILREGDARRIYERILARGEVTR